MGGWVSDFMSLGAPTYELELSFDQLSWSAGARCCNNVGLTILGWPDNFKFWAHLLKNGTEINGTQI